VRAFARASVSVSERVAASSERARAPTRCEDEAMRDAARDVHVWSRLSARSASASVRPSVSQSGRRRLTNARVEK